MQKQLNPELFSGTTSSTSRVIEPRSVEAAVPLEQIRRLEQHQAELRKEFKDTNSKLTDLHKEFGEFSKNSRAKMEQLAAHFKQLALSVEMTNNSNNQKMSQLHAKVSERKTIELKTQELVDRHNSVLKTYEIRLSQLQKLISEREQQVLQMQASLGEAKMELARLKRL